MTKENITKYAILGLLSHQPLSGYDIKKTAKSRLSYFWDVSYGQIYPLLASLEKEGLVKKKISSRQKGPGRNEYAITANGKKDLREWLAQPVEREAIRYELLLKVSFGSQAPVDLCLQHVREFRERNEKILQRTEANEKNLMDVIDINKDHRFILLTVLLGKKVYLAQREWANEAEQMLLQLKESEKA